MAACVYALSKYDGGEGASNFFRGSFLSKGQVVHGLVARSGTITMTIPPQQLPMVATHHAGLVAVYVHGLLGCWGRVAGTPTTSWTRAQMELPTAHEQIMAI